MEDKLVKSGARQVVKTLRVRSFAFGALRFFIDSTLNQWESSGTRNSAVPGGIVKPLQRQRRTHYFHLCVSGVTGLRSTLDRDLNGYLDGDELLAGSDPADASSVPSLKRLPK
jgi:hypothetical protein